MTGNVNVPEEVWETAGEYAEEVIARALGALVDADPADPDPVGSLFVDPAVTGFGSGGLDGLDEAGARTCVLTCPGPLRAAYAGLYGADPAVDAETLGWRKVDGRLRCMALSLLEDGLSEWVKGAVA